MAVCLLAFSRNQKESHSPADVRTLVEGTLSLISVSFRKSQTILEVDIDPDLPKVRCRSQQIQQVLMNLLTNAQDAMESIPETRRRTIRISATAFRQDELDWVRITVADEGEGIPPSFQGRVFDPFFTTKPKYKGTGLGLSVSYGIVQEHGGRLWFETQPGIGTRFHIDLKVNNGWSLKPTEGPFLG